MRYPGGKGKCFQHVINLMPPHHTYIETHLGGGAVLRSKRPAQRNIAFDLDDRVIEWWRRNHQALAEYHQSDCVTALEQMHFEGSELIYCDPPYLASTRKRTKVYRFDYTSQDHERLLHVLRQLPCKVIISGYCSPLYDRMLNGWNAHSFSAKAHDAVRQEHLWFNFEPPLELHDTRYLGSNFRQREVVRRRLARIKDRLSRLSEAERCDISSWLSSTFQTLEGAKEHGNV